MHTDLPLKENSNDKLGRHSFAYEVAFGLVKSFKDNNESIVLGINGAWGSGKSTLLNFIINEVEELSSINEQKIIVLKFNPWMFSGQKELQTVFLRELIVKLKNNSENLKNASKKIAEFLEYLNWVNYVHSGAGEALKTLKNLFKKAGSEKELFELKNEIDDILIESKVKLYITIDDIDRLTPSEVTDIFQLIKLNGNFANTIFILAYDQNVVETALENQFGQNGKKYIEKIVQVDYTLPSVHKEDISRLFIDNLNNLFSDERINIKIRELNESIKNELFIDFFSSLRDIYRYNNSIKLRLPSIIDELNILDFLIVESLRVFNKKVYEFIIENKKYLVYQSKDDIKNIGNFSNNNNDTKEFIENSEFQELIKNILKRLFVFDYFLSSYASGKKNQDLIRGKKVADQNYFDRYFNLQLSNFDIQEIVFENFININSIQENENVLKRIYDKNQLYKFLNWVKIKSKNCDESRLQNVIESLLTFSRNLPYKRGVFEGIGSDLVTTLHFGSEILYYLEDLGLRRQTIIKYLEDNNYFSSFFIADKIIYANDLLKKGRFYSNNEWFYLFKFEKESDNQFIEKIFEHRNAIAKELFDKILVENNYLREDEIGLILDVVYENYKKHYQENFYKIIEKDAELVKYIWISIKRRWLSSSGGKVGYQLPEYQLLPGLDKEQTKNRLDKFKLSEFDENENKVIALYKKAYEDGFKDRRYYDIETLEPMKSP